MMNLNLLHEIPHLQVEKYPNQRAFCEERSHQQIHTSIQEFLALKSKISKAFICDGIHKGDQVVICSNSGSALWFATDTAAMSVGLVTIPLYPEYAASDFQYIFSEINPSYVFCENDQIAESLVGFLKNKNLILTFEPSSKFRYIHDWLEWNTEPSYYNPPEIDQHDLATIIYTSGSTGNPKGVMLSHRNIISNIKAIITLIPITYRHTVVSFLPLHHIFERMVVYTYIACGVEIHFISNHKKLLQEVKRIRPHFISSVPRILEKIYYHIQENTRNAGPLKKSLLKFAKNVGQQTDIHWYKNPQKWLANILSDLLVYRLWRKIVGGRLLGIIVGAAAMDPELARLFTNAGIPIKEGYGLTETSPVVTFNRFEPGGTKLGTVGIPIPGVEVKIDVDKDNEGEILVKGPNVMLGYYKYEALTKQTIDAEGWLHTGDKGYWVDDRFLKISGRKKHIFKTSSGQYVYPTKIEQHLSKSAAIDQSMITGFQKPFVGALIVPDMDYLMNWAANNNVHWTSPLYMMLNDKVIEHYQSIVEETNATLDHHEKIRTFNLLAEAWSIQNGELTPTYKIKREEILTKYAKAIKEMYERKRR